MSIKVPSRAVLEMLHLVDTCGVAPAIAGRPYGLSEFEVQVKLFDARRFMSEHGATRMWGIPPQLAEYSALQHVTERLTYLERQAMSAWRASRGEHTYQRTRGTETTTVTRKGFGDSRYLGAAMKLAVAQVKVAKDIARVYDELVAAGKLPPFDDSAEMELTHDPALTLEQQLHQASQECMAAYKRMKDIEAVLTSDEQANAASDPYARGKGQGEQPTETRPEGVAATAAADEVCGDEDAETAAEVQAKTAFVNPMRAAHPASPPAARSLPFPTVRTEESLPATAYAVPGIG